MALLAYTTFLAGVLLLILLTGDLPKVLRHDLVPLIILTAIAIFGSLKRVFRSLQHHSLSIVSIILLAAIPLVGPTGAALLAVVAAAVPAWDLSVPWSDRAFNICMVGILGGVVGHLYVLIGGLYPVPQDLGVASAMIRLALPQMVANGLMIVLNAALISVMAWIKKGLPPIPFAWGIIKEGGLAYLAQGVIGFMLVVLWAPVGLGAGAVALVIGPILVAQWAARQVADEAEANERTMAALVAAGEAESIYSRGHSQRVAELTGLMATVAGRGTEDRRVLRMASLLHDIGAAAIPAQTWRGDPPYAGEQIDAYLRHPGQGVEMLAEIDFLVPALPAIESHHERWDGTGYPRGLAAEQIPWHARAIAVADAYDSLTSTRSYRPAFSREEALEELRGLAGTQFDPAMVGFLDTALHDVDEDGERITEDDVADFGPAKDHDDPLLAAAFADRRWRRG